MRLAADLTYHQGRFHSGLVVEIEDGLIASVAPGSDGQRLAGQALVPGAVNAHSHTFQRAIRGRTEYRVLGREDFWTWRERMYHAANALSPEEIELVARLCFVEMLQAGTTSVGEFHYLHHNPDGTPYDNPDELALRIQAAAEWAGIHLVLLRCGYARAGFEREANPLQRRFIDPDPDFGLAAVTRLKARGLAVGLAPHSLRAVPFDWFRRWAEYARSRQLPLHMHVAEQPREVEECLAEHGARPIELLDRHGWLDERFVGVHAIHLTDDEVAALGRSFVCSCPTTERNLGDGIVRADELMAVGTRICLGTDSQCQIDPYEDARQLEYHLRLRKRERAVLEASRLWSTVHAHGAASLGLAAGAIEAGLRADLVAVDLEDSTLAGSTVEDLPAAMLFGLGRSAIRQVWVGGRAALDPEKARRAACDFARVMGVLVS
ncbi:MAG: formimidoylglutamate deiminase [Candidatus Xenobia bacterium]